MTKSQLLKANRSLHYMVLSVSTVVLYVVKIQMFFQVTLTGS